MGSGRMPVESFGFGFLGPSKGIEILVSGVRALLPYESSPQAFQRLRPLSAARYNARAGCKRCNSVLTIPRAYDARPAAPCNMGATRAGRWDPGRVNLARPVNIYARSRRRLSSWAAPASGLRLPPASLRWCKSHNLFEKPCQSIFRTCHGGSSLPPTNFGPTARSAQTSTRSRSLR